MLLDDVRRTIEAAIGRLTPAKAQELAKDMLEPGAAKEQVAKTAADLLEWSQHNRERIRDVMSGEITRQMKAVGVASQSEVDALKKRVRELERDAGKTASGRKKTAARKTTAKKATVRSTGSRAAAPMAPEATTPEAGSSGPGA
jgi:polyhydroxyalkanoate synthesis regulator phasin